MSAPGTVRADPLPKSRHLLYTLSSIGSSGCVLDRTRKPRTRSAGNYTEITLDAGHWLMEEQTQAVVDAILAHIQAAPLGGASNEGVMQ